MIETVYVLRLVGKSSVLQEEYDSYNEARDVAARLIEKGWMAIEIWERLAAERKVWEAGGGDSE